jgi:hypothetical protein
MTDEEDMRRLEELAVSRLLETLSADEAKEYAALKNRLGNVDADIESVVALAHLAALPVVEPAPHTLRAAVEKDADEFFGIPQAKVPTAPQSRRWKWSAFASSSAGWWVGLAASVVAVFVLLHRATDPHTPSIASSPPRAPAEVAPIESPPSVPAPRVLPQLSEQPSAVERASGDLAAERRAFLSSHPHVVQRSWRAGGDATGAQVTGDVVWDEASQTGYMRFVNLRHNEPNAEQYQLWIFDAERDQRFPVDGGVFDVTSRDGEQIVRIQAKLRVHVPLLFAVTVEHPGGVVVSDRSRIAAIANVS